MTPEGLKSFGVIYLHTYRNLISFEKEDGVDTLFIKIDSDKEVDTDLCTMVSNIVNPVIDKLDLINEEYVLDICSKGEDNE